MKTVHEVSRISGVSVRTLHHYDAIGLLKPTAVTEAGYRLYDDAALARLQNILLYRELEFPLKEIKAILDHPEFDEKTAIRQQIKLLELRQKRLERLLFLAREMMKTGVRPMNFSAFDKTELEQYAAEAKRSWGATAAFREYEQREKGQPEDERRAAADELMRQFAAMGRLRELPPDSDEAQAAARELQQVISDRYYTCTPQILAGLGQMYTADERFRQNIDAAGGDGTAELVSRAIAAYCTG